VTAPPATRIPLGAPWWYRAVVLVVTIILIAAQAVNTWTTGIFDTKNAVLWGLTGLAIVWAWWDAWRTRRGVLHYADGQWVLALGDVEYQGTIQPIIDLPKYLLVKFTPQYGDTSPHVAGSADAEHYKKEYQQQCREKWLHLEPTAKPRTQADHRTLHQALHQPMGQFIHPVPAGALGAADWLALRRAVFAHAAP
jgi:hypothetical protein